ncbi:MAG: lysophospholipid acyltransferase family protein [Chitinophagaceae bacterium]
MTKPERTGDDDPDLPPLHMTPFWRFGQQCCRFVCTTLCDLKCYDKHNVPLEGSALLLANHQSFLDPPFVASQLQRAVCFLARSTLFDVPVFGPVIRALHAFPVERGKANIGAMKKTINVVQQGRCLLMFPEGTRTRNGEMKPLENGMALIIKKARVPVIPVGIDGGYEVWPRSRILPTSGKVRVKYGKPLMLHDLDNKQIMGTVESEIRRLIAELRAMRAEESTTGTALVSRVRPPSTAT